MSVYNCDLCSFSTTLKGNYKQHISSGKHKNNVLIMKSRDHCSENSIPNLSHVSQQANESHKQTHQCPNCGQKFAQKTNFYRHRKHYCKGVKGNLIVKTGSKNETSSELRKKEQKRAEWKKQIENLTVNNNTLNNSQNTTSTTSNSHNTTNTTNTNSNNVNSNNVNSNNNVQQQIVVNNFNKDSWDHVTEKDKIEFLKQPKSMIKLAFQKVNLNDEVPENHNIRVQNQKSGKVLIWEDEMWRNENKRETLIEVVGEKYYILDSFFRNLLENDPERLKKLMTPDEIKRYKEFSEKFDRETNAANVNYPDRQPLNNEFIEDCFYSMVDELIRAKNNRRKERKLKEKEAEERRNERLRRKELKTQ